MTNLFVRIKCGRCTFTSSCITAKSCSTSTTSNNLQQSNSSSNNGSCVGNFVRFDKHLERRRNEAGRSILVQVNGAASVPDIKSYLTTEFGSLSAMFHYSLPTSRGKQSSASIAPSQRSSSPGNEIHWILAEFNRQVDYQKAIESCRFVEGTLPYVSSMLWFSQKKDGSKKKSGKSSQMDAPSVESLKPNSDIDFSKAKTLSNQIQLLEESFKITELGIRLRFLVASQLETALKTFFPLGVILPFGSTVSGIGRQNGDLDLVLVPNKSEVFPDTDLPPADSRLWCQTKLSAGGSSAGSSRFQAQRLMESIADVIQLFVPGYSNVQRILQARVPILRFWSESLDLQCDLSMTNSSGIHMSELIYIMSSLDNRFPAVLCAIRSWASSRKVTNPVPGRQPTNFMLVLLLVYYLQCKKILPTLDVLFNNPGKGDARITADGIDCTFLREPEKIMKFFTPQNSSSTLAELLYGFFEFYSEFDFNSRGISLYTGSAWGKPDTGPMYLQNPLERHLNVARNVSREEVVRFKNECCAALWKLDTSLTNSNHEVKAQGMLLPDLLTSSNGPTAHPSKNTEANNINNGTYLKNNLKMKELFSE